MPTIVWSFPNATINRVVDGDTVEIDVAIGFGVTYRGSFRILGINARELHEPGGQEAKANLVALLPVGSTIQLGSVKNDKFSRYDALLSNTAIGDVSTYLINTGWAAPWDGNGPRPTPPWPRPV